MSQSTSQQRQAWKDFECNEHAMTEIGFGPDRIRVAPPTAEAWRALAAVFKAHRYQIRVEDTDSYNCREIKGGGGRSLHSFGIALDVNWHTNPFKLTPDDRAVKFSTKATQTERGNDVKLGDADTDMTPDLIADVRAIKTRGGKTVFEWGGDWKSRKDAMHFELDVTPTQLAAGIDWATVKQPAPGEDDGDGDEQHGVLSEVDMEPLTLGSRGDRVEQLQNSLRARGFDPGAADGVFGEMTKAAVLAFQAANNLPSTGIADDATLRVLASAPAVVAQREPAMAESDILKMLLEALNKSPAVAPAPAPAAGTGRSEVLQAVVAARVGRQPVLPAPNLSPTGTVPPILSPIDKVLGGEMLTGKKTALAVVAYAVLSLMQTFKGVDAGSTTSQVFTTLIASLGGLGLLGKVDRVTQLLGLMAGKPPAAPK